MMSVACTAACWAGRGVFAPCSAFSTTSNATTGWVCRRVDIARHWIDHLPPSPQPRGPRTRRTAPWPAFPAPLLRPAVELPDGLRVPVDLRQPAPGRRALGASDDFFAEVGRMLNPEPAVSCPASYDTNGKWMDGWEVAPQARRRLRLGAGETRREGRDPRFRRRHQPLHRQLPAGGVDRGHRVGESDDVARPAGAAWTEILPATPLGPNSHHLLECAKQRGLDPPAGEHLPGRRHRPPARVWPPGERPGRLAGGALVDLVAMENGGRAVSWNDASFGSSVAALLLPGRGMNMGDGWKPAAAASPATTGACSSSAPRHAEKIEVDTAFMGNSPDRCSIQAACVERRHRPLDHHPVDVLADPCPSRS